MVCTTNAWESVYAQLRKIIKTREHFPTDEAATKLIWLAPRHITAKWQRGGDSLAGGGESVRDTLRRPAHATGCVINRLAHDIPDTPTLNREPLNLAPCTLNLCTLHPEP